LREAEDLLATSRYWDAIQGLVRDAPRSAEAHCQLGRLSKAGGLTTRARVMFRKALELKASP